MSISHSRTEWQDFKITAPAANNALHALSEAIVASGLEKDLLEIMKLRASQMNGCTFCTQFHLNAARALAVPQEKLDLVALWRDAGLFSDREAAALGWTELLTKMTVEGVSDAAYTEISRHFSETELMFLTAAVANINAWNRIAVAFRFAPPIPVRAAVGEKS